VKRNICFSCLAAAVAVCVPLYSGHSALEPLRAPIHWKSAIQDKNFYALSLIEQDAAVRGLVQSDEQLAQVTSGKRAALEKAVASCGAELDCYAVAMRWTQAEIDRVTSRLRVLYHSEPEVRRMVDGPVRDCGLFIRYRDMSGENLLAQSWLDAAKVMNRIVDVYGLGRNPRYPEIDAVSYDVKSERYGRLVHILASVIEDDKSAMTIFFQPSLRFALGLLDINHRDEASRFEPLDTGENAAAIRRVNTVDWAKYPYSVIVVPGAGTETEAVRFSAWGKLRLTIAARRYREGQAPFLLVSGGFVHPNQTTHCEAIEMKRSLIEDFGIPGDAILIDPHARHTTTNLRNAARELYRYRLPFARPGLIATDPDQSAYIEGREFAERCLKELDYQPVLSLRRISKFELVFTPNIESLQSDPQDPLDP
jgi:hypothetical protein